MKSLLTVRKEYCLLRELKPRSERQIAAIVNVFLRWLGLTDVPIEKFTATAVSEFLAAKQAEGKSSYYRRSLRNTLRALYRFYRQGEGLTVEAVRSVKLVSLECESWTPEEVDRLIGSLDKLRFTAYERWYWRTLIAAAYHTGLSGIDLHRLERRHILDNGVIAFARSKTGKRVVVSIPPQLIVDIGQPEGLIWPRLWTEEGERLIFRRIVKVAELRGTFKYLRRSSGTQVELLHPGCGHVHLGHDREIFDAHYGDRAKLLTKPKEPPLLRTYSELPPPRTFTPWRAPDAG